MVVHHLQSQSGILDPDDRLGDVADDREQILASYEDDRDRPTIGQGDGASGGSSVGTGSPDIFRVRNFKIFFFLILSLSQNIIQRASFNII